MTAGSQAQERKQSEGNPIHEHWTKPELPRFPTIETNAQLDWVVWSAGEEAVGVVEGFRASPGVVEDHHRQHKHALPISAPIDFDVVHGFGSRLYFGPWSRWTGPSLGARDCTRAVVGSAGVAEQLADDVGRLLICALGPMRVDLHGGGAIGVAQPRGHGRNGYAGVEELCGLEVAEVVQPN